VELCVWWHDDQGYKTVTVWVPYDTPADAPEAIRAWFAGWGPVAVIMTTSMMMVGRVYSGRGL
jgi:hypothetical protein